MSCRRVSGNILDRGLSGRALRQPGGYANLYLACTFVPFGFEADVGGAVLRQRARVVGGPILQAGVPPGLRAQRAGQPHGAAWRRSRRRPRSPRARAFCARAGNEGRREAPRLAERPRRSRRRGRAPNSRAASLPRALPPPRTSRLAQTPLSPHVHAKSHTQNAKTHENERTPRPARRGPPLRLRREI